MRVILLLLVVLVAGCATGPEYELGFIDSYLRVGADGEAFIVDSECLIQPDYDALKEYCPECVDKRYGTSTQDDNMYETPTQDHEPIQPEMIRQIHDRN